MSDSTISRRELIRRGGVLGSLLALPAGLRATQGAPKTRRHRRGRASHRCERLPVDRRAPAHQRAGHVHDHQRFDDAARGAGGDGRRRQAVCAPRRTGGGGRRPSRPAHACRVGSRHERVLRGADARHGRVRRRRQSRSPRQAPEPERLREGRGHHPGQFAQRLRRGPPRRRRARRRGVDALRVRGGARTTDRADLHPGRAGCGREPAERESHRPDRAGEGRAHPRRCRRGDPDHPQCAPRERRDARGVQRRKVPQGTADRGPAARTQGSGSRRVGAQRPAPWLRPCAQGGEGRRHRDADGGRDVGQARSRGGMEALERLARSHRSACVDDRRASQPPCPSRTACPTARRR